jgi:GAF domain-containing protein
MRHRSGKLDGMAMHATTIRFTDDVWRLLEREAAQQGISGAQFIRDATIMRVAFTMAERDDPAAATTIEALAERMAQRRRSAQVAPLEGLDDAPRLAALAATGLLDSAADESFDRFTRLASRILRAPVSLVSLVTADRQFFKSCLGLPEPWSTDRETLLSHSFCQHAVSLREPLIIEDARTHPLVRDNLAIRDLNVVAYAGIPLITRDGHALGALCTIDDKPRLWTSDQIETLKDIAAAVVTEIEMRAAMDRPATSV